MTAPPLLPPLDVIHYTLCTIPRMHPYDSNTQTMVIKTSFSPHVILQPMRNHPIYHTDAYFAIRRYEGGIDELIYDGHVDCSGIWLMNKAVNLLDSYCFYNNPGCFVPKCLTILGLGHYTFFNDEERIFLAQHRSRCDKTFTELWRSVKCNL